MQNFALGLNDAPHEVHAPPVSLWGSNEGSGDGKVPGWLNASGADVSFSEIITDKGHDSFLLDVPDFLSTIKNYLNTTYSNINERRI